MHSNDNNEKWVILLDSLEEKFKQIENITQENLKEFISDEDLRKRLGISRTTLYNWRRKQIIPYTRVGNKIFYPWKEIRKKLMR